jgi:phosphatidylglycerol---prolipoprotein diacylglyceryl transferase
MFPVLLKIGIFRIYSYGLLVALGFIFGTKILLIQAKRGSVSSDTIYDLVLWILISSIIGARIMYVIFSLKEYLHHPLGIFILWRGGLVFYGGLIGAAIATIIFCRVRRIDLRIIGDWLGAALPLGHMFGRIGCFLAGCCYGLPAKVPWAVTFRNPNCLAPEGIPLHPTQLYSALEQLFIFALVWKLKDRPHTRGGMFILYLLFSSAFRFTDEFFRGDKIPRVFYGITATQLIAVCIFLTGVALHFYFKKLDKGQAGQK